MTSLLLIPLDDTVVFPTMDVTLPVDVGDDERVLLVPRHETEFAKVGTIAHVADRVRLPGGGRAVSLSGEMRGIAGAASDAYSSGVPSRCGCGTDSPSASRASCGSAASSGVSKRPGAIVQTRIRALARSRAAGSVIPTTPAFDDA